jgi:hypothetical protein
MIGTLADQAVLMGFLNRMLAIQTPSNFSLQSHKELIQVLQGIKQISIYTTNAPKGAFVPVLQGMD